MGYPLELALRYLGSKKRAFISVGTAFAILGVTLGVAALVTVMSVTGGFQEQFREKVLGVNAHVLVLKYSTDFREYRTIMEQVSKVPGVVGVAPFSINPMMLTHGDATATGVLLKGVDPMTSLGVDAPAGTKPVLELPRHIIQGDLHGLRLPGAKPPPRGVSGGSLRTIPDEEALDGGAAAEPERDDAGRNVRFLKQLEADIAARERARGDAGTDDAKEPTLDEILDAGAPRGPAGKPDAAAENPAGRDVTPDGGYTSTLPENDDIPDDVDPDPCANPELVKKLPGIVVGVALAKTLSLQLNDCVTVTSPTIGYSFSGGAVKPPVAKRFRVVAVFEAGFDQYDSKLVYTDLFEAQNFYDQGDTVTGVEMIVDDIDKAHDISDEIGAMLSSGLYHTMDWEELNHGLFTALRIQQIGMSAVLALIILVAAFTVVATLIMVVLDKKKEIAVIKAMGATDSAILRTFLYQGGIIGGLGTAAGLLLGAVVCKLLVLYPFTLDAKVYFISHLPVQARWQEFVITGQCALAICLDATILPALYAANLRPAEGFRDEISGSDGQRNLHWSMTTYLYGLHVGKVIASVLLIVEIETLPSIARLILLPALAITVVGAIAALAILLWKRWGFYVLLGSYAAGCLMTAGLVALRLLPSIWLLSVVPSIVVMMLVYVGVRRHWHTLE